MRKIYSTLLVLSLITFVALSVLTGCQQKNNNKIETKSEEEDNDKYDGADQAILFELERTKDPATGKVPWQKLRIAIEQTAIAKQLARSGRPGSTQALTWIERGPDGDVSRLSGNPRPNDDQTSGRIRATMIDSLDPTHRTVFAGSVAGGLWKTTNITASPANWTLVNDFLSNLAIADICQDPRPGFQNIMYMCTGESYGNGDAVRGVGVFKSVNAGATWTFLSSTSSFLNGTRILCDFLGNVYLGTRTTGLQRSIDGGASWTNITPAGIGNDICDLEISSTAVAARLHVTTGIFSQSGYSYTDIPVTVTSGTGWVAPTTPFTSFNQRIEFAVSGNVLYACPDNASHQVPLIWKSIDGGANWAGIAIQPGGGTWANGQGWYDLSCGINPANSDECIVGGLECYKTTTGGSTPWTKIAVWVGGSGQYIHADQQDIQWWDGGNKLMFACDGGIHYSSDGGATTRDRNKGLRIKQFYSIAIHPTDINNFIAGAQDNGMHRLNHPGLDSSIEFYGGDGMYAAIDQNEPQFQFGAAFNNNIRRTVNGGVSWGNTSFSGGRFVSPWDYDNTGNIMYICNTTGSFIRWNNPQGGSVSSDIVSVPEFTGNVSAVHVSPFTANRVFFGMGSGGVFIVDNANSGTSIPGTNITPAGASGYANCVVTGSSDQNLMACYSSYGVTNVFVSTNGGTSWTACDGNLPDMPVRWGLFHPDDNGKAYIATETGVWETDLLNGASTVWNANASFPNVRTDMIKYRSLDRTIAAGTHGRGVWTATVAAPGGFTFNNPAPVTAVCPAGPTMQTTLTATFSTGFSNPITLTASTPPVGTTVTFGTNPLTTGTPSSTVTLNNTNTLAAGSYVITITGTASGAATQTRDITFTITAGSGPAITLQPSNQTICAGANTTFSILSPTATAFQWQVSTDGGGTYTNVSNGGVYSGATSATLSITGATAGLNNNFYRAIASTLCGTTQSNAGILTVNTAPAITSNPSDATLCAGSNNTFSVVATGTGITYQWQISTNGCAGPWNNILGANSSSYTLTSITAGQNNTGYRAVVTGTCAPAATSNCALLTVITSIVITTQPTSQTICEGSNTSFTVAGTGTGIIYQWQVSTDGGGAYTNITNGGVYSGATSATLNITGATFSMNNYRYRAQLSNSTCTTPGVSNAAILTVNTLPSISANPQSATICVGGSNTFSVTAAGTGISYQWQLSTNGGGAFSDIAAAIGSSYTVSAVTAGMNDYRYRVVVSGTCAPAAISAAATLTVISPVVINTGGQPANVETCSGSNATFSVTGTSTQTIIYQWQVSTDGVNWTNITGANGSSYTVTNAAVLMNNNRYRVQLSNATCSVPTISSAATLTVRQLPTIGLTAAPLTSLLPGQTTTLTATPSASTGGTLSTSWYRDGTAFANAGNTYVADVTKLGSYQVKIQEMFSSGLICFNESPIVIISATVSTRLFIFPSPNDGRFTVSYYNTGGAGTSRSITIYDSKGAKVYNAKFPVIGPYTLLSIDLRPAQRGVYYVVVGDATGKKLSEGKVMVNW